MARISGVDIPREKRVVVSLTYLHGIGRTVAENICEKLLANMVIEKYKILEKI